MMGGWDVPSYERVNTRYMSKTNPSVYVFHKQLLASNCYCIL